MRKDVFVYLSFYLIIGSQQPKRIKVCCCFVQPRFLPFHLKKNYFCLLFFLFTHASLLFSPFQTERSNYIVIKTLVALLNSPEAEHPLRNDLAEEFTNDKKKFLKNAEGRFDNLRLLVGSPIYHQRW